MDGLLSGRSAERPVARSLELSLNVKCVGAEAVDVIELGRGNMSQEILVDAVTFTGKRAQGEAEVLGVPGDGGVREDGVTESLVGLLFEVAAADVTFVGEEEPAAQGMDSFALIEAAG